MTAAVRAPSLPTAAEKPWAVARTETGKTSAATRKVTELGPNWLKKEERKYMAWKAWMWALEVKKSYAKAGTMKRIKSHMKPTIIIHLRPSESLIVLVSYT